jgi:HK97 family phage major capsid protein
MEDNTLVYFGDAVKALGEGKVGGYLVRWGDPECIDLDGEFFTKETELGIEQDSHLPVYYGHGSDSHFKKSKIGRAIVTAIDDVGVWLEAQLSLRDEYEKSVYALVEAGKLGWSSGAVGHLVDKVQIGKNWAIKSWVIAEASLTPMPAEPRNAAVSIKSIYQPDEQEEDSIPEHPEQHEEEIMADETKTALDLDVSAIVESAVSQALEKYEKSQPQVKAGILVTRDEADQPMSAGEFFMAVKSAETDHYEDPRLKPFKASGLNEAVPSQGGYLVMPDIANAIYQNMWDVGNVLSRFNPIRVSGNGLTIHAINETSRATGSRMGGLRGYWLAEAAQKTASKPEFRDIDLKLKKAAVLVYASDEMLSDAPALEGWINNNVPNELRFMIEDAIIEGDGVGKPLGILESNCLVAQGRTTASQVADEDISRMWSRRYIGAQDYVWFVNPSVMPQLYAMSVGNFPVFLPPTGLAGSQYGTLFGRPVIETEYNPYLGTTGDVLLASPSQYAFITKSGIEGASSIHIKFDYDETAFRFVYRCDGEPIWNSAVTAFDGTATVSPFVALSSTTA